MKTMLFSVVLVVLPVVSAWGELPSTPMDYHDFEEMKTKLISLSGSPHATLKTIGYSPDYPELATRPGPRAHFEILALRIGPVGTDPATYPDLGDGATSILFVGGIHSREWLATESLIEFAAYLVENAEDDSTLVPWLLRRVAVWVIPMANPAGRALDDTSGGDPLDFYSGPGNLQYGWRHNAERRWCRYGVDVARNFSIGWEDAESDRLDPEQHYRGFAPFSTNEAIALRQFVQNHWIGMVIDVHTNKQRIWNRWGDADKAGKHVRNNAAQLWDDGLAKLARKIYGKQLNAHGLAFFCARYRLEQADVGGGKGQFTAWLEQERAIQTFMLELPASKDSYYDHEFEHAAEDGSNSFHPSSSRVRHLIHDAFVRTASYLVEQASAPGAATRRVELSSGSFGDEIERSGRGKDFGLLAAKIGRAPGAPGSLVSYPARVDHDTTFPGAGWVSSPVRRAFDYLAPGNYGIYYWIQYYGRSAGAKSCRVRIELKHKPHGSSTTWTAEPVESRTYALDPLEKHFDDFPFQVQAGRDYELQITARPVSNPSRGDRFSANNSKVFRFSTIIPAQASRPARTSSLSNER